MAILARYVRYVDIKIRRHSNRICRMSPVQRRRPRTLPWLRSPVCHDVRSSWRRIGIPVIMRIRILQTDKWLLVGGVLWITVCSSCPALIQPAELDAAVISGRFTLFCVT